MTYFLYGRILPSVDNYGVARRKGMSIIFQDWRTFMTQLDCLKPSSGSDSTEVSRTEQTCGIKPVLKCL